MVGTCGRMCGSLFSALIASLIAIGSILPGIANAQDFDWRWLGSGTESYVTPIRSQWGGTCWAFAAAGAAEAQYKITRYDPTYNLDLAEQHLVWDPAGGGSMSGGNTTMAVNFIRTHGIVLQGSGFGQIPNNSSTYTDDGVAPYWPIAAGAPRLKITGNKSASTYNASGGVEGVKANIKQYGPIAISIRADDDFYPPGSYRGMHAVVLTGWRDDAAVPGGGYFWIKNSWGGSSYDKMSYETVAKGRSTNLLTGPAYLTAPLGTATWQGGEGTWSTTNSASYRKWTKDAGGVAWTNGEDFAVFNSPGGSITVGNSTGNISTHGMTFQAGATGYSFAADTNNDPLIVTGGGITANEDVSFAAPMTVGAPQTWSVAAGRTLTVTGTVNTHISTLTVGGDGNTLLNNTVWDVTSNATFAGLLTGYSGSLAKTGAGTLTLGAASTFQGDTVATGGLLRLTNALALQYSTLELSGTASLDLAGTNFTLGGLRGVRDVVLSGGGTLALGNNGANTAYSGSLSGNAAIVKVGTGTLTFDGANTYTGTTTINGGVLRASQGVGLPSGADKGNLTIHAGILESRGLLTRAQGTGNNQLQLTGGTSGFSAYGGDLAIDLGGDGTGTGGIVAWGIPTFNPSTLVLNDANANQTLTLRNAIDLGDAARTIAVDASLAVLAGSITGSNSGGLNKTGVGTLALTGVNSFTGNIVVTGGALRAARDRGLPDGPGSGNLSLAGGVVQTHGQFTRIVGAGNNQVQLSGATSGFSAVGGDAVIDLGGDGSGSGPAIAWGGATFNPETLVLNDTAATARLQFANAIDLATASDATRTVSVWAGTAAMTGNLTNSGGNATLTKTGEGTLILSGANTYSGGTNFNGGLIQAASLDNLGGGSFTFDGGGLQFGAVFDPSVRTMTFNITSGKGTVLDTNGFDVSLANSIGNSGKGSLYKVGDGTLTLLATATHSGTTHIGGGALRLAGTGGALSGSVYVQNVGKLVLDNTTGSNAQRLNANGSVYSESGEIALIGPAAGITQTTGYLFGSSGLTTISVTAQSNPTILSLGGLSRGTGSTYLLRGTNLGTASSGEVAQIKVTGGGTGGNGSVGGEGGLTLSNTGTGDQIGIAPYALGDNSASGVGGGLVTYDATSGVRLLTGAEYNPAMTANRNVRLAASPAAVGTMSVRSLTLTNAGTPTEVAINSGSMLTLSSAAIVSTGSVGNAIRGGTLTFPSNSATYNEGFFHTVADLTVDSVIVNGSRSTEITKSGQGKLILNAANTYTGTTYVNAGRLILNGSIAGGVRVDVGAGMGGSGNLGMMSGSGLVSPGQSAGILTTSQVVFHPTDGQSGLDFVFEFSQTGSPD
ncbi:MAG: autotransporter-associated beta strand repeat-containing protein, partial [Patescibacteria group bacterium]|nr:autotransporter-associated beta strand repeat-containing protein [Patescibacteria group bacterium]